MHQSSWPPPQQRQQRRAVLLFVLLFMLVYFIEPANSFMPLEGAFFPPPLSHHHHHHHHHYGQRRRALVMASSSSAVAAAAALDEAMGRPPPPFTLDYRSSPDAARAGGGDGVFRLSEDLGCMVEELMVTGRGIKGPWSMTSVELARSRPAMIIQSLVLKGLPPLLTRLEQQAQQATTSTRKPKGKQVVTPPTPSSPPSASIRRAQPQYVPLLEAEDGSFLVVAHVLPFVKDRLPPPPSAAAAAATSLNGRVGDLVIGHVVHGKVEVSYYEEQPQHEGDGGDGQRTDCVCFGGRCPRETCEWREGAATGVWAKVMSRVHDSEDDVLVLHPYERRTIAMEALEPSVVLEVVMKRQGTEKATGRRMAEGAVLVHDYLHHPPYKKKQSRDRDQQSKERQDDQEGEEEGSSSSSPSLVMTTMSGAGAEEELHDVHGVGGLDGAFAQILRRVFASRLAPKQLVKEMGIKHVRGLLLHGPPGCGKTLLARQMSKMLRSREPKIVNGPEIFGSLVGKSEENIRKLFKEAEAEHRDRGEDSMLHVIVLDEMDSICSRRGSHGSNDWRDTVVNQLLTKIDGVDALNNILIIGMTNRKDLIDEALLRPGRLEVHVEVGLPDEQGRQQILDIHTRTMKKHKRLDQHAQQRLPEVARRTKNYSGADLEGLVKSSVSFAFERVLRAGGRQEDVIVEFQDIERSLEEMKPLFGSDASSLPPCPPHFVEDVNARYTEAKDELIHLLQALASAPFTQHQEGGLYTAPPDCLFALVEGAPGTGKTTFLSHLATTVAPSYPFIRRLGPEALLGKSMEARASLLRDALLDSRQSNGPALVILDGLELLLHDTCLPVLLTLLCPPPFNAQPLAVLAGWKPTSPPTTGATADDAILSRFHLVMRDILGAINTREEVERIAAARLSGLGVDVEEAIHDMGLRWDGSSSRQDGLSLREVHQMIDLYRLKRKASLRPPL